MRRAAGAGGIGVEAGKAGSGWRPIRAVKLSSPCRDQPPLIDAKAKRNQEYW